MLRRLAAVGAAIVLIGAAAPAGDAAPAVLQRVAVTIDDLPWNGRTQPGESIEDATRRLLGTLTMRGVPAVGLVNCARTGPDDPVLRAWRAAGMELGNHGANHLNLDTTEVSAWIDDARACHRMLTSAVGAPSRFFRFPFGRQGATESRRTAAGDALRGMGYETAHFTIDNSEWILADAYGRALVAGDVRRREAIAVEYVNHLSAALAHFAAVAQSVAGRDVAHVLLLHANALAADHLGQVLDRFRAQGVEFVTLAEALSDPIYRQTDRYVGPKGLSWLYRIDPAGTKAAQGWDDKEAERIQRQYGGPFAR